MVCAGDPGPSEDQPGNDTCQGDSGGPIYVDESDGVFRQFGVVSFGGALCGVDEPGVYVQLTTYLDWLNGIIGGDTAPAQPDPANPNPADAGADAAILRFAAGGATEAITQAVAISESSFFTGEAEYGVLARADVFADALGGSSLGYGLGPLLFTGASGGLANATRDELTRAVQPGGHIYILGGTTAVPAIVDSELGASGFTVQRLAGGTREQTAAIVADEVVALYGDDVGIAALDTVIVATRKNWPDAVAAGQVGSWWGVPILLTQANMALDPSTRASLERYAPSTVLVIGGDSAISGGVAAEIETITGPGSVTRLGGPTRTGTAASVFTYNLGLFEAFPDPDLDLPQVVVVVNLRRADAFAHVLSASMVTGGFAGLFAPLEGEGGDTLTPDVAAALCGVDLAVAVAGGPDLVTEAAAGAVQDALSGTGC